MDLTSRPSFRQSATALGGHHDTVPETKRAATGETILPEVRGRLGFSIFTRFVSLDGIDWHDPDKSERSSMSEVRYSTSSRGGGNCPMSNGNGIVHKTSLRAVRRWCGPWVLLGVAARPASMSSPVGASPNIQSLVVT